MMERFLERISLSEYRDKFILKGGMLVAAMVGLDARSTMDLDATVKGANVNVDNVENLISAIVSIPIDDGVKFQLKSISEIMDEAEYPGIRVNMAITFDGVVTPLKIDISTGVAITPREDRYSFKLMLEDRSIDIWAYNLETVLAEKLETIIIRTTTNTRMRDFYDIYILDQLHAIEGFNRQLQKVTKAKTVFPSDDSLLKMLYLAMMDITKKWTGHCQDWGQIHSQLEIFFEERLAGL